jgi:hypothetical protein
VPWSLLITMSATRKQTHSADPGTRAWVSDRCGKSGVAAVARELGLSRDATLALAAGAPVRVGTLAQARERIRANELGSSGDPNGPEAV